MTTLETLKAQLQNLLALAQAGHDVWAQMDVLSQRIRVEEEAAKIQQDQELRAHGFSLVLDGERVATAPDMERARILSVAMLQMHEDWGTIYVWKYGSEDVGRAEAVAAKNPNTRRIYWSVSTGG